MRRILVLCCVAIIFLAGCAAYLEQKKAVYRVEAYQWGTQIGSWTTAPGCVPTEEFDTVKFITENGEQVILQGPGLVVKSQQIKTAPAPVAPPATVAPAAPAPAAPAAPAAKPK